MTDATTIQARPSAGTGTVSKRSPLAFTVA